MPELQAISPEQLACIQLSSALITRSHACEARSGSHKKDALCGSPHLSPLVALTRFEVGFSCARKPRSPRSPSVPTAAEQAG